MMASLGNFKTLKISDARKNRRRTISEIDNFKNGLVSAVSIYSLGSKLVYGCAMKDGFNIHVASRIVWLRDCGSLGLILARL